MKQRGFTLVEVLVALVVLGVAVAASIRASSAVIDGSRILRRQLAGGWVAQNRINSYLMRSEFPPLGSREGKEQQAQLEFVWRETVSETPNRAFRRVEVQALPPGSDTPDAIVVGYVPNIPR